MAHGRGNWSGSFGFILAGIGSAVGLGNIWRFSFVAGQNGGAAFVLVYMACVLAVGIPVMLAEFMIGRRAQRDVVGAFSHLQLPMGFDRLAACCLCFCGVVVLHRGWWLGVALCWAVLPEQLRRTAG